MKTGTPITFPRVTGLIAGLFLRRFDNRFTAGIRRGKKPGTRAGTGRKRSGNPLGLLAIVVVFVFNYFKISSEAMKTLASEIGPPRDASGRIEVQAYTLRSLESFQVGERLRRSWTAPHDTGAGERALERLLSRESETTNIRSQQDYGRQLAQWYREKGLAGFVAVPDRSQWAPRLLAWDDPALSPLLIHSLGVVLIILAGARHCWTLGSRNQDLGRVEWSTEWLFTLPASSRALFGAQILGHAIVDPFSWIGTIPLLLMMYVSSGASWVVAISAALANSLYLGLLMASLRVVSETWLRKHLAPARLKNLQALFTLVGIVLLFMLFALARSQEVAQWVLRVAACGSPLLVWNPFSLPALALARPLWCIVAWEVVCAAVIVPGGIFLCGWLVRDGLVGAPAVYTGSRGIGARTDYLPAGIIGKDLRLLLRDRNFFVLQGVLALFFLHIHAPFGRSVVLSFSVAGALVVAFTLFMFWRARAVGVLETIGLTGPRDGRRARAVVIGLALGLVGAVTAFAYVRVLREYPMLFEHSRKATGELAHLHGGLLLLLGVVAAPLFEEFIFRGLVYRGMRRSLPARWSIVGSAAVFAICHPPASVIPVFAMATLAALGFEMTGWLVTPICVHMVYNGLVLMSGLFHRGAPL